MVKMFTQQPIVYNLQDIFPDSLVGTGLAKKGGLLWKIGRVIEDFTYKHADKIIVISEDFKKNIMAKGVPEDKIVVVYNWVDQNAVVNVRTCRVRRTSSLTSIIWTEGSSTSSIRVTSD